MEILINTPNLYIHLQDAVLIVQFLIDGLIHVTENAGGQWSTYSKFKGIPENTYVNALIASKHNVNTVYAVFNNHKNGDFKPYVMVSNDKGKNWKSISANLPKRGTVYDLAEDHIQSDLLFVGTEFGVFFSYNGGEEWKQLKAGLPTIAVKDIEIQEREDDLVLGTYGRGVYITDVAPIKEISNKILNSEIHLFEVEPQPKKNYSEQKDWGNFKLMGDSHIYTPNEPNGLMIYYYLKNDSNSESKIIVSDNKNSSITEIIGSSSKGINRVVWDTKDAKPGQYNITLKIGKKKITKKGIVEPAYKWAVGNNYN